MSSVTSLSMDNSRSGCLLSLKHSAILRESLQGLAHGNSGVFGGSRSQSLEYIPHSPSKHLGRSVSDLGHLTMPSKDSLSLSPVLC